MSSGDPKKAFSAGAGAVRSHTFSLLIGIGVVILIIRALKHDVRSGIVGLLVCVIIAFVARRRGAI